MFNINNNSENDGCFKFSSMKILTENDLDEIDIKFDLKTIVEEMDYSTRTAIKKYD